MAFAFIVTLMLLGSSVAIAFVLQPSREEPATSETSDSSARCKGESLEYIRNSLLHALNLQSVPRLPADALDGVREQWRRTFGGPFQEIQVSPVQALPGYSGPPAENSTILQCCSTATEIYMKDLGWDNWVLHPTSVIFGHCALCSPTDGPVPCPLSNMPFQDPDSQMPCCQPTSEETVPVVYVTEFSTVVISSVQLVRGCGCGTGGNQKASVE